MTALIGILATDGVVIAADSTATSFAGPQPLLSQPTMKIEIIGDIIVAGTGAVGHGQRFIDVVKRCHNWEKPTADLLASNFGFKVPFKSASTRERVDMLAALAVAEFNRTGAMQSTARGLGYGALVAIPGSNLVEYDPSNFQPEIKEASKKNWIVAMGSGQIISEPMLVWLRKVLFGDKQPNVEDACFMVTCAMEHVIEINPGGVGGDVCIATLQKADGAKQASARLLNKEELDQHRNRAQAFRTHVANFEKQPPEATPEVPNVG